MQKGIILIQFNSSVDVSSFILAYNHHACTHSSMHAHTHKHACTHSQACKGTHMHIVLMLKSGPDIPDISRNLGKFLIFHCAHAKKITFLVFSLFYLHLCSKNKDLEFGITRYIYLWLKWSTYVNTY